MNKITVDVRITGVIFDCDFVTGIKNLNVRYTVDGVEHTQLVSVEGDK